MRLRDCNLHDAKQTDGGGRVVGFESIAFVGSCENLKGARQRFSMAATARQRANRANLIKRNVGSGGGASGWRRKTADGAARERRGREREVARLPASEETPAAAFLLQSALEQKRGVDGAVGEAAETLIIGLHVAIAAATHR